MVYFPLAIEVDPGEAVLRLFEHGCTLCVPTYDTVHHRMWPVTIRDFDIRRSAGTAPAATTVSSAKALTMPWLGRSSCPHCGGLGGADADAPCALCACPGHRRESAGYAHAPRTSPPWHRGPKLAVPEPDGGLHPPTVLTQAEAAPNLDRALSSSARLAPLGRHHDFPRLSAEVAGGPPVPLEMIDVVLVPGLAFTADGRRLGRGAGYYERLLSQSAFQGEVIGLAFDEQIVEPGAMGLAETAADPVEPGTALRLRVDTLVTESGAIRCRETTPLPESTMTTKGTTCQVATA